MGRPCGKLWRAITGQTGAVNPPALVALEPISPRVLILGEAALTPMAVVLGWAIGHDPLATLRLDGPGVLYGVAATLPMVVSVLFLRRLKNWAWARHFERIIDDWIRPLFHGWRVWQLALVSLAAGVGEELIFRGLLQGALALDEMIGKWPALAIASVLFGLVHPISRPYVVLAAGIGLYLGGLWMVTGNLVVPIIAHGLYDFLVLIYVLREARD